MLKRFQNLLMQQLDFDVWFEKYQDHFSRFKTNNDIEVQNDGTQKKKRL